MEKQEKILKKKKKRKEIAKGRNRKERDRKERQKRKKDRKKTEIQKERMESEGKGRKRKKTRKESKVLLWKKGTKIQPCLNLPLGSYRAVVGQLVNYPFVLTNFERVVA